MNIVTDMKAESPSHEEIQQAMFGTEYKKSPKIIKESDQNGSEDVIPVTPVLVDRYHVVPGRSGHYAREEILTPQFFNMLGHTTHQAVVNVSSYGSFRPNLKNHSSPFGRHKFTVTSSNKSSRIAVDYASRRTSELLVKAQPMITDNSLEQDGRLVRLEVVQGGEKA